MPGRGSRPWLDYPWGKPLIGEWLQYEWHQ